MVKFAIGIDLGGTYTKLALVGSNGKIFQRSRLSTTAYGTKEKLLKAIVSEIEKILARARLPKRRLAGVGIGLPGPVDFKRGLVYDLTNVPGWKNTPLKRLLERKLGLPVLADNDVNVMALGECRFGAGRGAKYAVCITLGTGVGGGIIIDGEIYRGPSFSAGEVGHMPLKEEGLACNCGGYGCLERYVGNRYISDEFGSTPETLSAAARKGDRAAIEAWERIGKRVGTTLAGVVNLLNPEKIIIGGGLAGAGELLFVPIRKMVKRRAMPVARKAVKIVKARLGNDAGMIGAAALFF